MALTAQILAYYAENAETFLAPEPVPTTNPDEGDAVVVSTPLGVILGIQPWNFPYYQLARVAAPNLMAGNVVMVKHASNVPQAAAAFERLLLEVGAPGGRLHQPLRHQGPDLDPDRRPACSWCRADRQRGGRRDRGIPRRRQPQEVHHGTRRHGRTHRAGRCRADKTVQWALRGSDEQRRAVLRGLQAESSWSTRSPTSSSSDSRWRLPTSRPAIRSTRRPRCPRCRSGRRRPIERTDQGRGRGRCDGDPTR